MLGAKQKIAKKNHKYYLTKNIKFLMEVTAKHIIKVGYCNFETHYYVQQENICGHFRSYKELLVRFDFPLSFDNKKTNFR